MSALSEGLRRQEQLQQPQEALRNAPQQNQSRDSRGSGPLKSESMTILLMVNANEILHNPRNLDLFDDDLRETLAHVSVWHF